jgi:hypothetical protein
VVVLREGKVIGRAEELGQIDRDGLVELERIGSADEIGARQEERIERRVCLDGRLGLGDRREAAPDLRDCNPERRSYLSGRRPAVARTNPSDISVACLSSTSSVNEVSS